MSTHAPGAAGALAGRGHAEEGLFRRYLFSLDHKTIGKQFLWTSLLMMLLGGLFALVVRWQLAWPGKPVPGMGAMPDTMFAGGIMLPEFYNAAFTLHASIMIFFVIIPMLTGAFANFVVPLQIGARDMAFPALNRLSFWLLPVAIAIVLASLFVPGGAAQAGWTSYPPLAAIAPLGQTLWCVGVIVAGLSSITGAVNYITTILNLRAPGMTMFRLPLTTWAIFITSILVLLATPVLSTAMILLTLDRVAGTSFFLPADLLVAGAPYGNAGGGQPLLYQHLFWFYSHPAVYIMILPAMGVVSDVLATFARKPIFGYKAMVFAMAAISGLGFIVWGHHMFQSGMNPLLGSTFSVTTMVIAVPSAIKTFNWLGTLWGGRIRFTAAMLNALAFVSMFVVGGLSGIFMASAPVDIYIHDTYFIVAHIHYVLFGGSLFAIFAGLYFWFPKMFGRMLDERLGKIHFAVTFVAFNAVFFPMHIAGAGGMMRRIYDPTQYEFLRPLQPLNVFMTVALVVLFAGQVVFVYNWFRSLARGAPAEANPWRANDLLWAATPPHPGHGNFDEIPTVLRGPYEYSSPLVADDYLPQHVRVEDAEPAER